MQGSLLPRAANISAAELADDADFSELLTAEEGSVYDLSIGYINDPDGFDTDYITMSLTARFGKIEVPPVLVQGIDVRLPNITFKQYDVIFLVGEWENPSSIIKLYGRKADVGLVRIRSNSSQYVLPMLTSLY